MQREVDEQFVHSTVAVPLHSLMSNGPAHYGAMAIFDLIVGSEDRKWEITFRTPEPNNDDWRGSWVFEVEDRRLLMGEFYDFLGPEGRRLEVSRFSKSEDRKIFLIYDFRR